MKEENGLVIFSCDENKENYSQRNNKFNWRNKDAVINANTTCNATSYVMFADYAGWHLPSGKYEQPEDNFTDFIVNSPEVDTYYKTHFPAMYKDFKEGKAGCYTPNEIHKILCYAFNLWVGVEDAARFLEKCNIKSALWRYFVADSLPLVLSGSFPTSKGKALNHIVVCTGVAYKKEDYEKAKSSIKILGTIPNAELLTPAKIKIDDPYGNTLKDWQGSGNDVWLDWNYVVKNVKPLNSPDIKWAHTIKAPVAIV